MYWFVHQKAKRQFPLVAGARSDGLVVCMIFRQPKSLYRGMAFPLVSEGVRSSLFFGVYGKVLDQFGGRPQSVASYPEIAVAAAVGGGVQGIAATPVELVKIQLQSANGQYWQ